MTFSLLNAYLYDLKPMAARMSLGSGTEVPKLFASRTPSLQICCFSVPFSRISYFASPDRMRHNYCRPTYFHLESIENEYEG